MPDAGASRKRQIQVADFAAIWWHRLLKGSPRVRQPR